jgi:DNA-directed RNA polymerase subunit RPC12/RpoP
MPGADEIEIEVACQRCGRTTTKTTRWLNANSLLKCDGCGEKVTFTTLEAGRRPRSRRDWEAAVRKLNQHGVPARVK